MTVITRLIQRPETTSIKTQKPTVIEWKGVQMIRGHSINSCVDEIIEFNKRRQFLKINLIGMSGSGKTTLSHVLAHQIHTRAEVPYETKFFKDEQLINFNATVAALSNNNQILIFDDLSGLVSKYGKTALDNLKAEITTIRHINDQEDRKIIMILNFHAQKLLDKSLRISNFSFYTDCQLEEIGYLEELLGKREINKIKKFQRLRAQAGIYHKFTYTLSRKDFFTYKEMDPFLPLLYNNGLTTRHVVSPSLDWILEGKECSTCKPAISSAETKFNLNVFMDDYCRKFTKGIAKRAVELKLLQEGIETQPKRVLQAREYIEQFLREKKINLEELQVAFNLKPRITKLFPDKQPDLHLIYEAEQNKLLALSIEKITKPFNEKITNESENNSPDALKEITKKPVIIPPKDVSPVQ